MYRRTIADLYSSLIHDIDGNTSQLQPDQNLADQDRQLCKEASCGLPTGWLLIHHTDSTDRIAFKTLESIFVRSKHGIRISQGNDKCIL